MSVEAGTAGAEHEENLMFERWKMVTILLLSAGKTAESALLVTDVAYLSGVFTGSFVGLYLITLLFTAILSKTGLWADDNDIFKYVSQLSAASSLMGGLVGFPTIAIYLFLTPILYGVIMATVTIGGGVLSYANSRKA